MHLTLGHRPLSPDSPPFVIAELGVNHDGSVDRAIELLDLAKGAGADAAKLQVFQARTLVRGDGVLAQYQKGMASSSAELLRRLELAPDELLRVADHARTLGLPLIATPFSLTDVPVCRQLGLAAIKIASPDVVNHLLLESAAGAGLPLLVSTGAATLEEIATTVRLLKGLSASFLLMHCVSAYPTPPHLAHLRFIHDLTRRFGALVGYSDHVPGILAGALAVAAGAVVLERHFTYDTSAPGPDHPASSDPREFAGYVHAIHDAWALMGEGHKRVLEVEEDVRKVSRQSLVLARSLAAGEPLTRDHLTTQRPGIGITPDRYPSLIGRIARQPLEAGSPLSAADFE